MENCKGSIFKGLFLLYLLVSVFSPVSALASDISHSKKSLNILWIFSWHKDLPWQKEIEQGIDKHFSFQNIDTDFYYEYLDGSRLNTLDNPGVVKDYISEKYRGYHFDYIVFESEYATRFYLDNQAYFSEFGSKKIVVNPEFEFENSNAVEALVPVNFDYSGIAPLLNTIHPDKNIVIVSGDGKEAIRRVNMIIGQLHKTNRKIEQWSGLTIKQLSDKASKLPSNYIIVYALVFQDSQGTYYKPYRVAEVLSDSASVPVYSFWTSLVGSGVVGGYMLSGERVGEQVAKMLANDFLTKTMIIPEKTVFHDHFFDYRETQRWGIKPSQLPENSILMFHESGVMEVYYKEIIGASALCFGFFYWLRSRELKRYNSVLDKTNKQLKQTHKKLINTQQLLEDKNRLLKYQSITDGLTKVFNRNYLDKSLKHEVQRANRYKSYLSVIMVDIDHFKQINDSYGHQVGDVALVEVAKMIQENIRETDIYGRWGGEEFLIICPGTSVDQTLRLAEKLRVCIEAIRVRQVNKLTASFGVSGYSSDMSLDELLAKADSALYRSKEAGRNSVCS
jgi:diguanylate cyclase (GGDEF)-like protein